MIKYFHILFFFIGITGMAQNDSIRIPTDSNSVLTDRAIDGDLNQRYSGEEFNYEVKTGESANLLSRFVRWFLNTLNDTFGFQISPETLLILEYIIYVLIGTLAIYLVVRLFVNEKFSAIFTKKAKTIDSIDFTEEHIEEIDLDSLMQEALRNENFRLAVRYQFLKVLKILSQKNLIEWHFEKTNADYQREIKETSLQVSFKNASYLYENIWYGEQPIDKNGYAKTNLHFDAVKKSIQK
ncbi:hypothetical protein [Flagellimonas okinawensis]|uniref:DUF4129 domain-containing protein n=1 Tax=Flagellimonas okinawensis TaxID=3031324 RepID=A0ABT5XS24_9FLAO|nr:hypothetical protein [[Muricauda] okinawensis]MDF0708688.1 hypothetical protein [[Muricauda] okinawensis]